MEENNKLAKRQLTISTINMVLLIVVLAVLTAICIYVFQAISSMETTVNMIDAEVRPIIESVEDMDVEKLNEVMTKLDVDKFNDLVAKLDGVMNTITKLESILG